MLLTIFFLKLLARVNYLLLQFSAACTEMGQNNIVSPQHTCSEGCWGRPWEQEGCSFTQWLWYSPLLTINLSWQRAHVAQGEQQPRWEGKQLLAVKNMRRAVPHLLGNQGRAGGVCPGVPRVRTRYSLDCLQFHTGTAQLRTKAHPNSFLP